MTQETTDPTDGLRLFRTMALIRAFETAASRLMIGGVLPGFVHVSIGQEAIAAGVCDVLRASDQITTTHRGHGHCIAKGGEVEGMVAELFGRENGYGKGRSGSMHIADPAVGILGANAIVGGGLPMAVGAALSAQLRGGDDLAVTFFGEGAVAQGVFHECLNLAALWKLPVLFVCENNQYAEMTHYSVHLSAERVADFAGAYGIPSEVADGNDVWAVREATVRAVDRARGSEGPTVLEFETYRWGGHFEGDPASYRTEAELLAWKAKDPLEHARRHLSAAGVAPDELASIEVDAGQEVDRAVAAAEAGTPAPIDRLLEDVYAGVADA
jgi:acetoin:2,6-dichlorophenolindophenol oxidoreductase subunit alpha